MGNTKMTEPELKPIGCPLCGKEADHYLRGNDHTKKRQYDIHCKKCNLLLVVGDLTLGSVWVKKTAIEKWNTRTTDDKYKKAIEFIKRVSKTERDSDYLPPEMSVYCEHVDDAYELLRELGESE